MEIPYNYLLFHPLFDLCYLSSLYSFFSFEWPQFKIFACRTPVISFSPQLFLHHTWLFFSLLTYISNPISPLPSLLLGRYRLSTSLSRHHAPQKVMIFMVFLSITCKSSLFQSMTLLLYLNAAIS